MDLVLNWNKGAIMGAVHAAQYINQYITQLLHEPRAGFVLPAWFVLYLDDDLQPVGIVTTPGAFDPAVLMPALEGGNVTRMVSFRIYPDTSHGITADDLSVAVCTSLTLAMAGSRSCTLLDVFATTLEHIADADDDGFCAASLIDMAKENLTELALRALASPSFTMGSVEGEYVH